MCRIHNYGIWDRSAEACFAHFLLADLCFVYNLTSESIEKATVQQWTHYEWTESEYPRDGNATTGVTIRASTDPVLYDKQLKAAGSILHIEKVIIGALVLAVSCLLFLFPAIYFWQVLRSENQRLLQTRGLELTPVRQGYMPRY